MSREEEKPMLNYIKLLRPKHGVKSLLALIPLLASGNPFTAADLGRGLLAVGLFWMAASGVYVMNDLLDAPRDRLHPVKKTRPIASGAIPPSVAVLLAGALWLASVGVGLAAFPWQAPVLTVLYIALNAGYSLGLKDVPVVDVAILAAGFLIRVSYGGLAVGRAVSPWLWLAVAGASFHLVFDKRRNELVKAGGDTGETRKVLASYDEPFLSKSIGLCRGLAVGGYAAWTVLSDAGGRFAAYLPVTVPMLLVVTFLYDLAMGRSREDKDMVSIVMGNRALVASAVATIAAVGIILYA